jgi:molecular chaperone HscB
VTAIVQLSDDFALFDLPQQFNQDSASIDSRWKSLQREVHPDRFAAEGAAAQRIAAQYSARINQARERLRNPLKRATYLCALRGAPIDAERNTAMPADFLIEQMVWREALDEAKTSESLNKLAVCRRPISKVCY